jgi:glycine C-acetyltransferase
VGTLSPHHELQQKLAAFKGVAATLSRQSGFTANLTVIPALVQAGDAIFSDELNHASIIDGCRLSGAQIVRYCHCDAADLAMALQRTTGIRRRLVITAGVFSMDGEITPLPEIVQVAMAYNALVMVDDAHREGELGRGGRGITEHFGLQGQVDVESGP